MPWWKVWPDRHSGSGGEPEDARPARGYWPRLPRRGDLARVNSRVRNPGLQAEILASLLVVVVAGLAIVAVVMGGLATQTVERGALERLRMGAHHLERMLVTGSGRLADLGAAARSVDPRMVGGHWTVLDSDGRQVAPGHSRGERHPRADALLELARHGEVAFGGGLPLGDLELAVPLHAPSGESGVLLGVVPGSELERELTPLFRSGGWVLAIAALVFAAFGSYLLRRRIVLRVHELAAAAHEIAAGDLRARVSPRGTDELADLAHRFNGMATSLEAQRTALIDAQRSLARSERLASVGRLAAGVAHEVGNPVAAILGYLDVAVRRARREQPNQSDEVLIRIRDEALRIKRLIRELLDLARSDTVQTTRCRPTALLETVAERVRPQPALCGIALELAPVGDLAPLDTDPHRVEQILVNLIENAAHATAKTAAPRIELRAETARLHPQRRQGDADLPGGRDGGGIEDRRSDAVRLSVTDNGSGIDPDDLLHVFDPFFTTRDPGGGTGLGLWNAHRLAELLGGRIEAESRPGRTRFSLVLPSADRSDGHVQPSHSDHR